MWTIFRKEIRENLIWACAMLLILLLLLDYMAAQHGWVFLKLMTGLRVVDIPLRVMRPSYANSRPIEVSTWAIFCMLAGLGLALKQVYHESWRKTWPLLAHLPISRPRMVMAKVLAGMSLYAAVFVLAAVILVARLTMPGVWFGPVYWREQLPMFYFIAGGFGVYLATFFAAFRPARWYGTKWLILIAGVPTILVIVSDSFIDSYPYASNPEIYRPDAILILVLVCAGVVGAVLCLWGIATQAATREY